MSDEGRWYEDVLRQSSSRYRKAGMMSKEESGRQLAGDSRWESSRRMERKEEGKLSGGRTGPPFIDGADPPR